MIFFLCSLLVAGLVFARGTAMAEAISGSVEVSQSLIDSKATDASGLSSSAKTNSFYQRYQLNYNEMLYPYLNLRAGSSFDKTINVSKSPDGDTRLTDTNIFPTAALTLFNPFVSSGVGYSRREETVEVSGGSPATNILESKNAFLGFKPEGLPTLDMQVMRSHTYDKAHVATDSEFDSYSATTRFTPVQYLDLSYNVTLNNTKDLLAGVETDFVTQTGQGAYSRRFFNDRVFFTTDYLGSRATSETQSGNGGEVAFQLFPFAGLSDISDTPTLDVLSPNQALVDGNLAASSGINIGQGVSFGGDTRLRSVGLDFVNATGVNTLYIYVDRQLPASIADTVAWDVYVSSDNQNWVPFQTGLHGAFNPFANRFELLFPDVTTRYIKAAVRPLAVTVLPTPGTDISNVFITELQSFVRTPAAQVAGRKIQQTSQLFDASVQTTLLQNPLLQYSIYFSQANSSGSSETTFLSNALSIARQLNAVFAGSARVAREDSRNTLAGKIVAYTGSASLTAVPLPTLYHNLVWSGRWQDQNGLLSNTQSVFLNNTAVLYEGINVNLSGGLNFVSVDTGGHTENTIINGGVNFIPNKYFSMNVNHSESESSLPGGLINRAVNTSGGIAWVPVATVYLAYSLSAVSATNVQSQTTQGYSASWAPFSGGALNFSVAYSETLQSAEASINRTFAVGAECRIGPRTFLTASYNIAKSSAPSQSTDTKSLSTDLRMSF